VVKHDRPLQEGPQGFNRTGHFKRAHRGSTGQATSRGLTGVQQDRPLQEG
jgi:hypothetical protein